VGSVKVLQLLEEAAWGGRLWAWWPRWGESGLLIGTLPGFLSVLVAAVHVLLSDVDHSVE